MVVGFIARNPNAVTPRSSSHIVTVNADVNLIVGNAQETGVLRCSLVYVIDIAIGRVRSLQRSSASDQISEKGDQFTVKKVKKLKKALEV